jgi:hypothetical protein
MYRSVLRIACFCPSASRTTIARAVSRDWIPYEAWFLPCWTCGSKSPAPPSRVGAYCPAEDPTWYVVSTVATPASNRPCALAPSARTSRTSTAATSATRRDMHA